MANPIERLYKAVLQTGDADPASSRTALLLHAGRSKIGKEVAEEAIEVAFEAMQKIATPSCIAALTSSSIL